ncbi:methyltransferase domain-containing protein [Flavobacterium sp. MC2016-06]|jgi:2-polyprenyl-3-methyl-5-hydroxy-6-metoxy-1,4-benzoquinol methylase|uniref:methyltransferase domain-containing protein n=1 Tax=Flavobacterium sp. MC2016-06 TaxID=2676308 RepID=UPI0012BACAAD|nr:methyltransferase domain-containing protein [Flavobacterium sp. MC2016-06]MBU3860658.1 methyltransferase domain-containing protein [Flavobacterium sp. MC2016-06]
MAVNTKYRTQETEIMDDFSLHGEEFNDALDTIARINQLLGGNSLTLNSLKKLLKKTDKSKTLTIADIGCGNGDMLRLLANYGIKNNINFNLIGIDANAFTIDYAKKLSTAYPNINYQCLNIFSKEFNDVKYDIVLCTLTLHHFTNEKIESLIKTFNNNSVIGIVVNDLHRSKTAYRLFQLISAVFNLNKISREDGLISILRGFRKNELENFSNKLNLKNYTISWKWAFRYQWIITKL